MEKIEKCKKLVNVKNWKLAKIDSMTKYASLGKGTSRRCPTK